VNWQIKFSRQAEKYYMRFPSDMRKRVKTSLLDLAALALPFIHSDVTPLLGKLDGFYRLRIGKYRVVFSTIEDMRTIAVVSILPRGDVYKK